MDEKTRVKLVNQLLVNKDTCIKEVEIRPSATCNLRCISCDPRRRFLEGKDYIEKNNLLKPINKEVYLDKIKECAELRVSEIMIGGGGEPLMRKDIVDIMKAIKDYGISGNMLTNGTLFSKRIFKKIIEIKWDNIMFSVDAPNERLNDFLRGKKNAFNASINNVKRLVIMKKNKPGITLAPVISKYNQYKIIEFLRLAEKLKVNDIIFQPVTLQKKFQKKFYLVITKKFCDYLKRSIHFSKKFSLKTNLKDLQKFYFGNAKRRHALFPICFEPLYKITIQPNGNADPCPIITKDAHREIKDINIKYKSIKSIWNNAYFKKFRRKLLSNQFPNKRFCPICCGMLQLDTMKTKDKLLQL